MLSLPMIPLRRSLVSAVYLLLCLLTAHRLDAADWPMWRYDAQRSNASPQTLMDDLYRAWRIDLPVPLPAWPDDQEKLAFDRVYEPIVVGQHLFVGSMTSDHMAAYDTRTGALRWRFPTTAPVRFAPAATADRLYFVCDDGFLYCLSFDGQLQWRVRGGPSDAKGIGNGRLVSLWPARGAPVIADGVVYFAASIWPFMGTFVHAVDARTGAIVWTNSGTGADYVMQQHSSQAFAGVAPQGYLAISGNQLVVPGGLTVPAMFSRSTGALLFFDPSSRVAGRDAGGYGVATCRDWYFNRSEIYERAKGALHGRLKAEVVTSDGRVINVERDSLRLTWLPASGAKPVDPNSVLAKLTTSKIPQIEYARQVRLQLPRRFDAVGCVAGSRAYVLANDGALAAVELAEQDGAGLVVWRGQVRGRPLRVIAADDRLFVATAEGAIYCFAPVVAKPADAVEDPLPTPEQLPAVADSGLAILVPRMSDWATPGETNPPPSATWMNRDFDDSGWKTLLVALDEDAAGRKTTTTTKEGETPPPPPEFTGYFRRAFTAPAAANYGDARLTITAPDRTSVWLDGKLVGRFDVRNGTPANGGSANPRGPKWASHEFDFDPRQLSPGRHVLAVEVPRLVAAQLGEAFLIEVAAERSVVSGADQEIPAPPAAAAEDTALALARDHWNELMRTGAPGCWCVVHGDSDGSLAEAFAKVTSWHIVVLEPNPVHAARLRHRWIEQRLLGTRLTVLQADWNDAQLPPYFASVVIDARGRPFDASHCRTIFSSLRPYGGLACVRLPSVEEAGRAVEQQLATLDLDDAEGRAKQDVLLMTRPRGLTGAGNWTHQNADPANTLMSRDRLVRLPLGILWFGGPSNAKILPRHGHGPVPQVVDGRLIIEGPDLLRAVDIYTGRLLWERKLKGLGVYYNNTAHHPGAGAIGGNYVSMSDGIYVAYGRQGLRLDPDTGRTLATFTLPNDGDERLRINTKPETPADAASNAADSDSSTSEAAEAGAPYWGHLAVVGERLLVTSTPTPPLSSSRFRPDALQLDARYGEASRRIVVLDRRSGTVRWKRDAKLEFRHNAIVAGEVNGHTNVFCLDAMTDARKALLKKRGVALDGSNTLLALDADTGVERWRASVDQPYTWLGYSQTHDIVLAAGSRFRDRASDEAGKGLVAYRGATGAVLWRSEVTYAGPCLLHDDQIITQGEAFDLLTGKARQRLHPLTGESVPWEWHRNYGCNTAVGCPNLLTFRSAAAGFFDLATESGTGNFGGFRSSCTNNLIPAGGLLNAPDYTRTCTCSYQNQTSLALVHRPDVEYWTFDPVKWSGEPVERLGLNFGAPGDRRDADGTLWMEVPSVGGRSPDVPVKIQPRGKAPPASSAGLSGSTDTRVAYFRRHSSTVDDTQFGWIAASGVRGEVDIEITLAMDPEESPRDYLVRLYFAEVDDVKPGARTFDVRVQDHVALEQFDIARETQGERRTVVKEVRANEVRDKLLVSLRARAGSLPPQLNGLEIERVSKSKGR